MYNKILDTIDRIRALSQDKTKNKQKSKSGSERSSRNIMKSAAYISPPQRNKPDMSSEVPYTFGFSSHSQRSDIMSKEKRLSMEEDKNDDNRFYDPQAQAENKYDASDDDPDDSEGGFVRKKGKNTKKPIQDKPRQTIVGNMPSGF